MDKPAAGTRGVVETAQNLLGFLIAGFAAVLSFIGIKSSELASILRNEEPFIGIVALAFLFSIITAILSIFKGTATHGRLDWPTNRFAVASLLFLFAMVTLLPAFIHIPFVTSFSQVVASIIFGVLAVASSFVIVFRRGILLEAFLRKVRLLDALEIWRSWSAKYFNLQLYLALASVLFLTIAAYAALRLESASQSAPFAQLEGRVTVAQNGSALLSLSVASAKVPAPDRVDITVTALPRTVSIGKICKATKAPLNSFSCTADPCSYKPSACQSLVGWTVPPDATGAVREVLTLPFSPSAYQRLHIEDQLCERASATLLCANKPPGGTHLDVQVPAPST
ncbi:MAG TPA: hypothetical protein VLW44_08865 [Streptosporangiaceae bacterium]|nr:hypothetical protein [Streptosporangiaceae bacterium]